ncbi:hypothetical protein [Mucilaginibacter agri]|uniref:Uncharacterized protein n=1 Tax=Mucilaginibacter agri TaxID=2695265 RepID=A0A965ZIB0_9SPHI|nr:hypothetical protein [Mucilaginibacter agri]NCD71613.1 hypothetical protein [Mucilaginibacter agri]
MQANDPSSNGYNATGHASIFDGQYCVGGIYHTPFNIPGKVKEIVLWILQ